MKRLRRPDRRQTSRRRTATPVVLGLVSALVATLLTGCAQLPDEGPLVETPALGEADQDQAIAIDALPPDQGAPAADIAKGFLDAMSAWPIQTKVARKYLSDEAQASWSPQESTIIFGDDLTLTGSGTQVSIRLPGAERIDARGAWQGSLPRRDQTLRLTMVVEDGEYRIANPPDALVVPAVWFEQRYRQASLYFFNRTARILVPEPVFVPRGDQFATALVKGLLAGPVPGLDRVSRSFVPRDLSLDLSVPVSAAGVADIALAGDVTPTPETVDLMVAQLTWTLRQEPSIRALRVSLGGEPLQLPGGTPEVSVKQGDEYDPTVAGASTSFYGLRRGLLVAGESGTLVPVSGPLGSRRHDLRRISVNLTATTVAGVSRDGGRLLLAPARSEVGSPLTTRVRTVLTGASRLLPPVWDFADRIWLVDRRPSGALVSYLDGARRRRLRVTGVSGREVRAFLVSRDATRFIAVVRTRTTDQLRVGRIRVDDRGRIRRTVQTTPIAWEGEDELRVRDIAWTSPITVSLLTQVVPGELFEVRTVGVDGVPTGVDTLSTTVSGRVRSLAGTPVPGTTQYAVTARGLVDISTNQQVELDGPVTSLDYPG